MGTAPTAEPRCARCGALLAAAARCPRCETHAASPASPARRPFSLARVFKGLVGPLRGLIYVARHAGLWAWIALPLLVNTLLFAGLAWLLPTWLADWLPSFEQPWPAWIDWARTSLGWLLNTLFVVVCVLAALLATLMLSGVVNAPFYDKLSEATEAVHLDRPDPGRPWSRLPGDLVRSLTAALSLVLRQALVMAVLFALSFSAVGAPLFAAAGFYYAGLAQHDVTLARKLYRGTERSRWGRRRWMLVAGSGVLITVLPLLAPFGIVGATLAYLEEPQKV